MMKILLVAVIGTIVSLASYVFVTRSVINVDDTVNLHVLETHGSTPTELDIIGSPLDSSEATVWIGVSSESRSLVVRAHTSSIVPGLRDFQYRLSVPDSVDTVKYGNDGTVIWDRSWKQRYVPDDALSPRDIRSFEVHSAMAGRSGSEVPIVNLTGWLESGKRIEHVATVQDGDCVRLTLFSGPGKPASEEGNLWRMLVPDGVNRITFGPGNETIWQR